MFDRLLDHFSTLYLGVIGAIILHAVFFFFLLFRDIHTPAADLSVGLKHDLEVEMITKEEALQQDLLLENPSLSPEDVKNISTSASDNRETSTTDFGQQMGEEQLEQDVQDQYAREFDELFNEAQNERGDLNHEGLPESTDLTPTSYQENVALRNNNNAYAGKGMAHLELINPDRKSRRGYLKVPGYTGVSGGTIVINIVVDQAGYVVEASVDYAGSTITESAAVQNALSYAKRERFNRIESAPKKHYGTITYVFKAQ